jgi:hypothetical protein
VSQCGSCDREILWAVTASGKRMPVDAVAVPDGNVVLEDQGRGRPPLALVLPQGADPLMTETERYVSHFVTCKFADQHRRPR